MKSSPLTYYVRVDLHLVSRIDSPPDEAMLRKRIGELQQFRKLGLTTAADIKKWEDDLYKRVRFAYLTPPCFTLMASFQTQAKANMSRDHFSSERLQQLRAASARQSLGPDTSRRNGGVEADRKSVDQTSATGPSGRRPRS
jgi:transcriptional adapter 2-alpha